MIYVVDTNIFLRTLVKDDVQACQECVDFLRKVKTNKIDAVTPSIVLSEMVWVLTSFYKLDKRDVVQAVKGVLNLNNLKVVNGYDYIWAINQYYRRKVKYTDCVIAWHALDKKKYRVVSYDKDFDQLPVKRILPDQVE